mgnify:CR=1 FL=1
MKIEEREKVVNNELYFGQVDAKGKKHGLGRLFVLQNGVYEGEFKLDVIHGYGRYIYPNYEYYEGFWMNGLKNGEGKMVYPNGDVE